MIQLRPDCLVFQTENGESIPCSAETVTIELIGEAASLLNPDVVREASLAIVHYFKYELGKTHVSIGEFSVALEDILNKLGFKVSSDATIESGENGDEKIAVSDLCQLASECGKGFELGFFSNLKKEMEKQLQTTPHILRFQGLRECVKQLMGTRRWTDKCQDLNDQIVSFLRQSFCASHGADSCSLVVL